MSVEAKKNSERLNKLHTKKINKSTKNLQKHIN